MPYQYNQQLTSFARELRREQTNVEHLLWTHLRNRQAFGYKFRRQFPLGPYILDFYCSERKLVIELDGGQHNEKEKNLIDIKRTQYLARHGMIVLRFWNNEVRDNLEGVMMVIEEALSKTSPSLS